jgi:hypothetical protein
VEVDGRRSPYLSDRGSWSYVPNKARAGALKNGDLVLPEGSIAKRRGVNVMMIMMMKT